MITAPSQSFAIDRALSREWETRKKIADARWWLGEVRAGRRRKPPCPMAEELLKLLDDLLIR